VNVACATPSVDEAFVVFPCGGDACVGILSRPVAGGPSEKERDIGVVIVVGGPQYRVGSHRQFTLLARALAKAGVAVLRFDYRGMGDSEGEARTFDVVHADLSAAVSTLVRETGVARVVLWGLCDGASAALMYAAANPAIAGVVALNPWARTEEIQAATQLKHYYVRRLLAPDFWRKVLRGRFDTNRAAGDFVRAVRGAAIRSSAGVRASFLDQMQAGWSTLRRPVLFILSGYDMTAREFEQWVASDPERRKLFRGPLAEICTIPDADHTFSSQASRAAMTERTLQWIGRLGARR
jgi:exosortase A-associated hydrolase 1